jgi:hypothetical protein
VIVFLLHAAVVVPAVADRDRCGYHRVCALAVAPGSALQGKYPIFW